MAANKRSPAESKSASHRPSSVQFRHRRSPLAGVWSFLMWLVGVVVALAIGFSMAKADGALNDAIPLLGPIVHQVAGWIVIILTLLGVLLKIIDALST